MTKVKSFPCEATLKAKSDAQNAFDYAIKEAAKKPEKRNVPEQKKKNIKYL